MDWPSSITLDQLIFSDHHDFKEKSSGVSMRIYQVKCSHDVAIPKFPNSVKWHSASSTWFTWIDALQPGNACPLNACNVQGSLYDCN